MLLKSEKLMSKEALKQIEEKKYFKKLEREEIKKARLIGIAFSGKEVEVSLKEIDLKRIR